MPQISKSRWVLANRAALRRLVVLAAIISILLIWGWQRMIQMPGHSYQGKLKPLTPSETVLRDALKRDVQVLASEIKARNASYYSHLTQAADFLTATWTKAGLSVQRQEYKIGQQTFANLEVEIPGTTKPDEILVIGGHYDSAFSSPGANDNGTGAAATLELARLLAQQKPARTLRFVEFVNEEPPYFQTSDMGSLVYARRCRDRQEKIVGMLSLETLGYYSDLPGSQQFPFPLGAFYPSTGNYIAFIGNTASSHLVKSVIGSFRRQARFPSEGAALPGWITGVGWSDQWAFWQQGYSGLMVTDTAPFRYPYYHTEADTPDRIDYDRLARVVQGLAGAIANLASEPS